MREIPGRLKTRTIEIGFAAEPRAVQDNASAQIR
jgi:hypothetical protein